ncbi:putative porin [Rufibacter sp. LB8]|uniref:putative porin n=1 Tax=Rufibacter sp. LB8 TaxID=2777781 RepID=UPI00178C19AC
MNCIKRIAAAIIIWAATANLAQAQIIDDSTKAIYGSATTLIIREADIFKGNLTPVRIDTALTNLQSIRHWYYDSSLYQDLGNIGTASQPLFWRMPTVLGARLGRNAFDRYAVNTATVEFYDTKSPHTFLNYVQGGLGESIFRTKHTRNIGPNWNVGIGYERLGSERQFGQVDPSDNALVSHYGLQAFTHYFSKNDRYRIMAIYAHTSHDHIESGGVQPKPGQSPKELLSLTGQPVWLSTAVTDEKRTSIRATQWYKLIGPGLQLYHTVDAFDQANKFTDVDLKGKKDSIVFYPRALLDTALTQDNALYWQVENTFGLMGSTKYFVYRAYAKRRDGEYRLRARGANYVPTRGINDSLTGVYIGGTNRTIKDNFIGGEAQFRLRNDIYVTTNAEFMLGEGDYLINAQARYKFLTVRQTRASYSPTLTQQLVQSNHFAWNNDFENITSNQTAAVLESQIRNHFLSGQVQFTNLRNYVYYQDSLNGDWAQPAQVSGNTDLLQVSFRHRMQLKFFVLDNTVFYNAVGGNEVIRMPEWYVLSKAYVQTPMFKSAIFVQAGVEMNWHSSYFADGYMPVTQQFHLQNSFNVTRYPTLDLFLNTDIKNLNIFLKLSHVNNVVNSWEPGYYTTPNYIANPFSFLFGLKWNFYD